MARSNPNWLLVEGIDEKWVLPQLIEKLGVVWGEANESHKWPAQIKVYDGVEKLLAPDEIGTVAKGGGVKRIGVIVDADTDAQARWEWVRREASKAFPSIPETLSTDGIICVNEDGVKFGVWVMPDNRATGMLETFLGLCVPDRTQGLWPFVEKHCDDARTVHSAPYKSVHRDKALIHSWLALQNPPGQQMHSAIIQKILVPSSPHAAVFLSWFCKLFDLAQPVS